MTCGSSSRRATTTTVQHLRAFQVAPAAFNALVGHAAYELAALGGDQGWKDGSTSSAP